MAELRAREAKLVQYLNEAFGKEKQLETALEAHIGIATRPIYKKRLQEHLRETKGHARDVKRRIKQLGGSPEPVPVPGPDIVTEAAGKAAGVVRRESRWRRDRCTRCAAPATGEQQLQERKDRVLLRGTRRSRPYKSIETVAEAVGDRDTARLARGIRRQEERMASFLERLIPMLAKEVVQDEIPRSERNGGRRRSTTSRSNGSPRSRAKSARAAARRRAANRSVVAKPFVARARSGASASRPHRARRRPRRPAAAEALAPALRAAPRGRGSSRSASRGSRSTAARSKAKSR